MKEFEKIAYLISKDNILDAIIELEKLDINEQVKKELILLKYRKESIRAQFLKGIFKDDTYILESNKITDSLILLLEELRTDRLTLSLPNRVKSEFIKLNFKKIDKYVIDYYVKYNAIRHFQHLLDNIYYILRPKVKPKSYAKEWYLFYNNEPIYHSRKDSEEGMFDFRLLKDIGIVSGTEVEVVGHTYINSIFNNEIIVTIADIDNPIRRKEMMVSNSSDTTINDILKVLLTQGFIQNEDYLLKCRRFYEKELDKNIGLDKLKIENGDLLYLCKK